ncbi:MAG: NAD(P)H-hydrate dehydratase [Bacteroidetes bacterium]|nr:NAD(P)H-hydrate dehydratase [Bacteroidota bacterium]
MKILTIDQIREGDAYTIENEPVADIDLMERAANELFLWISASVDAKRRIKIFCGCGNNGGDGFALARMLAEAGYTVETILIRHSEKLSPSCELNFQRILKLAQVTHSNVSENDPLPEILENDLVVDAIFGSGLTRPVTGLVARAADHINSGKAIVVAVDVPTGFFCDTSNSNNGGVIVRADYTLTFQFPKYGFFFPENDQYVGDWKVLPIGIHPGFIQEIKVKNYYLSRDEVKPVLKKRTKFSHKGTYGHGLLIAGSYGKLGAAVLAAQAGLKAGAGLITAHIPKKGNTIIQTAVPAAMVSFDSHSKVFSELPYLAGFGAIAAGPGLGMHDKTQNALKLLIQDAGTELILDADALNILSENKTWISFIPKNSIFTPHPKEFERLAGKFSNDFERNERQREFSTKYGVFLILKGAYTAITTPEGNCYFNSTGNPGMATGGSGDVLTGILLGLKAQGYSSLETCLLGVYLHGLAGDLAAKKWGLNALTANEIIGMLGKAFRKIEKAAYTPGL